MSEVRMLADKESGNFGQDDVPCRMPVGIVDLFEVIYVDHDQGEICFVPAGSIHLFIKSFEEVAAVGQAGQFVGDHQFGDFLLCFLKLAHEPYGKEEKDADHYAGGSHDKRDDDAPVVLKGIKSYADASAYVTEFVALDGVTGQTGLGGLKRSHVPEEGSAPVFFLDMEFRCSVFEAFKGHAFKFVRRVVGVERLQAGDVVLKKAVRFGQLGDFAGHHGRVALGECPSVCYRNFRIFQVGIGLHTRFFFNEHSTIHGVP